MPRMTLDEYRSHFTEAPGFLDFARWGPPSDLVAQNAVASLAVLSNDVPDVESMQSYQRDALSMVATMTGRDSADAVVFASSTSAGLFQMAFAVTGGPDVELLVSPGSTLPTCTRGCELPNEADLACRGCRLPTDE